MNTSASTRPPASREKLTRDARRERWIARVPRWYSPEVHLFGNLAVGLAASVWMVHDLMHLDAPIRPWVWLAPVLATISANVIEYFMHRYPMHRRKWWSKMIFRQHTLHHHRYYLHDDMEVEKRRDMFFVIFQVQFGVFSATVIAIQYFLARWTVGVDFASIVGLTLVAYFFALEGAHVLSHLPSKWFESGIMARSWLQYIREHHRVHHDPKLMTRYNFNITFPLGDWIFGTIYSRREESREANKLMNESCGGGEQMSRT